MLLHGNRQQPVAVAEFIVAEPVFSEPNSSATRPPCSTLAISLRNCRRRLRQRKQWIAATPFRPPPSSPRPSVQSATASATLREGRRPSHHRGCIHGRPRSLNDGIVIHQAKSGEAKIVHRRATAPCCSDCARHQHHDDSSSSSPFAIIFDSRRDRKKRPRDIRRPLPVIDSRYFFASFASACGCACVFALCLSVLIDLLTLFCRWLIC